VFAINSKRSESNTFPLQEVLNILYATTETREVSAPNYAGIQSDESGEASNQAADQVSINHVVASSNRCDLDCLRVFRIFEIQHGAKTNLASPFITIHKDGDLLAALLWNASLSTHASIH